MKNWSTGPRAQLVSSVTEGINGCVDESGGRPFLARSLSTVRYVRSRHDADQNNKEPELLLIRIYKGHGVSYWLMLHSTYLLFLKYKVYGETIGLMTYFTKHWKAMC